MNQDIIISNQSGNTSNNAGPQDVASDTSDDLFSNNTPNNNPNDTSSTNSTNNTLNNNFPDDTYTNTSPDDTYTNTSSNGPLDNSLPNNSPNNNLPNDTSNNNFTNDTSNNNFSNDTSNNNFTNDTFSNNTPNNSSTINPLNDTSNPPDEQNNEEKPKTKCQKFVHAILVCLTAIYLFIFFICAVVILYFLFVAVLHFTFFPLVFGFISLCYQTSSSIFLLLLPALLADYGIFFVLILISLRIIRYVGSNATDFCKTFFSSFSKNIKNVWKHIGLMFALPIVFVIAPVVLGFIWNIVLIIYISAMVILPLSFLGVFNVISFFKTFCPCFKSKDGDQDPEDKDDSFPLKIFENSDSDTTDDVRNENAKALTKKIEGLTSFIWYHHQMFGRTDLPPSIFCCNFSEGSRGDTCWQKHCARFEHQLTEEEQEEERKADQLYIKALKFMFTCLVLLGQGYTFYRSITSYSVLSLYGKIGTIFGIIIKVLFLSKAIDINIYDSFIFNFQSRKDMEKYTGKATPIIVPLIYLVALIFYIVFYQIIVRVPTPSYVTLEYKYNDTEWYRNIDNPRINLHGTPSYCSYASEINPNFGFVDYAALTTLPRLYEVTKKNKCRFKRRMESVFNATMEYIFGEDYLDQDITIMCYPYTHDPYLVITSKSFRESFFNHTDLDGSTFLGYQFPINESQPQMVKQITLNRDTVIQPLYIDQDNNFLNGYHIIVGGGYEDAWGLSYIAENLLRVFIPELMEQFIPFYGLLNSYFKSIFSALTEFALGIIYVDTISYEEFSEFNQLIAKFNFSHKSLFMVGHSTSGSTMKEFSYESSIKGMVFETSQAQQYAQYRVSSKYTSTREYQQFLKNKDDKQNVANFYSVEFISGNDDDFDLNLKLPSHFYLPNVYDTTCLVYASCSPTMKYDHFCRSLLEDVSKKERSGSEMLDSIIESYYQRHSSL